MGGVGGRTGDGVGECLLDHRLPAELHRGEENELPRLPTAAAVAAAGGLRDAASVSLREQRAELLHSRPVRIGIQRLPPLLLSDERRLQKLQRQHEQL